MVVLGTLLSDTDKILKSTVCYYGPNSTTDSRCNNFINTFDLCSRILLSILIFTLGQKHFKAQAELRKSIHSYDIRDAKLHVEADREMILQFIDELFQTPG